MNWVPLHFIKVIFENRFFICVFLILFIFNLFYVSISSAATLTASTTSSVSTATTGTDGTNGTTGASPTAGTDADAAVKTGAGSITLTTSANLTGGNAGSGGSDSNAGDPGADAGASGDGISVESGHTGVTLRVLSGTITGGAGAAGGNAGDGTGAAGISSAGGAGVDIDGASTSLSISSGATVLGGNGGSAASTGMGAAAGTDGAGIKIDATGATITNAGTIKGGNSSAGIAIDINAGTAIITNTGTIGGETHTGDGINLGFDGTTTSLTNAGTIRSTTGKGIDITSSDTLTALTNSGTISVTSGRGIDISGILTTLTNSGTISATTGTALYLNNSAGALTFDNTEGLITSANTSATEGTITVADVALAATRITGGTISNTGAAGSNAIYLGGGDQTVSLNLDDVTVVGNVKGGADDQYLYLDGTSSISGDIDFGAGSTNVLALAGTHTFGADTSIQATGGYVAVTVAGTVTINGEQTSNTISHLYIGSNGVLTLNDDLSAAGSLSNSYGTLVIGAGATATFDDMTAATYGNVLGFALNGSASTDHGNLVIGTHDLDLTNTTVYIHTPDIDNYLTDGTEIMLASGSATSSTVATLNGTTATDYSELLDFIIYRGDHANIDGSASDAEMWVEVDRASLASIGNTTGNDSVGTALDTIAMTGPSDIDDIQIDLMQATSPAQVNDILEAAAPTLGTGPMDSATTVASSTGDIASSRMSGMRGLSSSADTLPSSAWVQSFGVIVRQDNRANIPGYDGTTFGVAMGADTEIADGTSTLGVAFSYGSGNIQSENAANTQTDVHTYQLSLYGDYDLGDNAYAEGVLSYGWAENDGTRHATGSTTQNSNYTSHIWGMRAEIGQTYNTLSYGPTITPQASINYMNYASDSYIETGTGALLSVGEASIDNLEIGIGSDISWKSKNRSGSKLEQILRFGYAYNVLGDSLETTSSFLSAPANTFETSDAPPARSIFSAGAGLNFYSIDNWLVKSNYDFRAKANYNSHTGVIRGEYKF